MFRVHRTIYHIEQVKILRPPWSVINRCALVATSADSVPSSNIVRITIAPIGATSEIFSEGGIKIISLSNIRPITIYFHSSQCRLIPYLHQRPIFFKANSIRSFIVAILELFRGAQCLIEVIRSSGEEMWRVDAYQIPYYIWGIEKAKRTHPRCADWFDMLSFCLLFTLLWSENLNSDGHHFYQYHLISLNAKKITTYNVGKPGPWQTWRHYRLMGSQSINLNNWISNDNRYHKQTIKKPPQILFQYDHILSRTWMTTYTWTVQ